MNDVPNAGHAEGEMRIVREDGFSGGGVFAAHYKIVTPDDLRSLLFELR